MSVQFFILGGSGKRTCEATDSHKAAQILRLMFHNSKGYVVENNRITFAQNMTIDEAAIEHGLKVAAPVQSMEVLPVAPKAATVKPKKAAVKAKPKKTTIKSKVVVKAKKKAPAKKAAVKVKPKAKPTAKVKAKKPVKSKKSAPKGKAKKR